MPAQSSKRFCSQPGCSALTLGPRCDEHQQVQRAPDNRENACRRGYDAQWRKLAQQKLGVDPFCEIRTHCRYPSLATEVDHITPIKVDPSLRLTWRNLQSTCHACHVAKTNAGMVA